MEHMAPEVSIIVPCWGHPELADLLIAEIALTVDVPFELILIDNGGGVSRKNENRYPWLRIFRMPKNLGFGGANNYGATQAQGKYLLFLNNDVRIKHTSWLRLLLEPFAENPKRITGAELVKVNDYTKVLGKHTEYINGWCMVMPKAFFESVGGFDEQFGLGWFEDVYLCHQAKLQGYELYPVNCGIRHLGSSTIMDGRLDTTPMMVRAGFHFRDRIIKDLYPKDKLRIVVIVSENYKFSDVTWEGRGTGGAEASLILWSREMAALGHRVEIYNKPEKHGEQNGVHYFRIGEYRHSDYADVVIVFRNPISYIPQINAAVKIFWSCDQYTIGNFNRNVFPYYDKVICISQFHKDYFLETYSKASNEQIEVIDLGVNLSDYRQPVEKMPGKLLFCSVPHRGLLRLIPIFKKVKARVPMAQLYITSDYTLWGVENPDNSSFYDMTYDVRGIKMLGKVSRKELVHHQNTSEIMVYPSEYDENFCVSAAECMAAGALPIVFPRAALKTTVGDDGILVDDDKEMEEKIVHLLSNSKELEELQEKTRMSARRRFDWEKLAKHWEQLLYSWRMTNYIDLPSRLPDDIEHLSVLDLACGEMKSGISTQIPLLPFKEYTGVELWEPALSQARKKEMKSDKVTFISADITQYAHTLAKTGKQSDVVFLFDIVEHLEKEDALKLIDDVQKIAKKRILIFMPLGEGTLEANDGVMVAEENPLQKHKSQWSAQEWRELGFDVEELRGFHHGGKLDAAWIIKDTKYMKKCTECGAEFQSSYYLGRHRVSHTTPGAESVMLANDIPIKMPRVELTFTRKVELSVGSVSIRNETTAVVPYEQVPDVIRILQEAYGNDIILSQNFSE